MHLRLLKAYARWHRGAFAELGNCKQADTERALLIIRERIVPGEDVFCDCILAEYSQVSSCWGPRLWFLVKIVCCVRAVLE